MDWEAIKPALDAKLDPAHVRPPSKFGPKGDYIEGWHAIAEANRIFGHGGWSYVIKGLTENSLAEGQNSKGDKQWQAAYTCIVTVTVGDVVREDVGFGSGFAKQVGDAIEGATKEAVTDALKRALRTFGNPFGLALYDKSRSNVGATGPSPQDEQARVNMIAAVRKSRAGVADNEKFKRDLETLRGNAPELAAHVDAEIETARAAQREPDAADLLGA